MPDSKHTDETRAPLQLLLGRLVELDAQLAVATERLVETVDRLTTAEARLAVLVEVLDVLREVTEPAAAERFASTAEQVEHVNRVLRALLEK